MTNKPNLTEEKNDLINQLRSEVKDYFKYIRENTIQEESIFRKFTRIKNEKPEWFQKCLDATKE